MTAFTVTAVQPNPRDWNATVGGAMKAYRVSLKDDAGNETPNVEWSRKATSPAPEIGEQVEGTLDTTGPYGPKFKKTPTANSFGGGGGGGGRGRSPEEEARTRKSIQMQHAQKCAVDALKLAAEFGDYKPPAAAEVVAQVKLIASGLFQQIEEVQS